MRSWREDWLHRLTQTAQSEERVFEELAGISTGLGFEYCSVGMRLPVFGGAPRDSWLTTYPTRWQHQYLGNNYLSLDPVVDGAFNSWSPIVWDDDVFTTQRPFWEEARLHGIRYGWTLAIQSRHGETGLISVARSNDPVSAGELDELEARLVWLSHTAIGVIGNIASTRKSGADVHDLTPREREVLRWTAAGKTSFEIGIILGISARTVNFHVTSILSKLQAVNKTQAVVKAVLLDLLD
jgi:LuxR family transcriptional regulator